MPIVTTVRIKRGAFAKRRTRVTSTTPPSNAPPMTAIGNATIQGTPRLAISSNAMTAGTYVVSEDAALATVAAEMAEIKLDSAVVMNGGRVVGLFTSIDAVRALASLCQGQGAA